MTEPLRQKATTTDLERAESKRARNWLTVGFSLAAIVITLLFVSAFSVGFTIVLGMFVAVIAFHYFVWGWWLGKMLEDDDGEANI